MELIGSSPTFILGTFADGPNGGADASNRGGNPGFVQALDESTIVFPDYKVKRETTLYDACVLVKIARFVRCMFHKSCENARGGRRLKVGGSGGWGR